MVEGPHAIQREEQLSDRARLRVVRRRGLAAPALDSPRLAMEIGALDLELGGHLEAVTVAYRTWGSLNAAGDNAVLVLHALTGDSLAAGPGGWWEPLIGPGRALDTEHAFVICANILGGCQGTTGPASDDPLTGRPYGMRFPLITIGDIVNTQRALVERLGVRSSSPSVAPSVASRHSSGRPGTRSSSPALFRSRRPVRSTPRVWP